MPSDPVKALNASMKAAASNGHVTNGHDPDFVGSIIAQLAAANAHEAVLLAAANSFVDWATFWDRDRREADWCFPDVLARGRGHAIYAGHKTGKSLFMLHVAALIATGTDPNVVVYLDYEMGEDDLYERLDEMGYGPHSDLSRLRYALLPTLPPLDRPEGAKELDVILDKVLADYPGHHLVVIIDTTGRAVEGDENSADTIRAFYRWTGLGLKQRGATWARLDHAGKDGTKGQRGTSAKGDDVDVIWQLSRTDDGLLLRRDSARMSWIPEKVTFHQGDEPLRFVQIACGYPSGTAEVAQLLDNLNVELYASGTVAIAALKANNTPKRKTVVLAALRSRKEKTR